jgi:hypothetical protein
MPTPKPKNRAVLKPVSPVETKGAGDPTDLANVTVRVIRQPINEGGVHYSAGETFETSPERAAALAGLVEIV